MTRFSLVLTCFFLLGCQAAQADLILTIGDALGAANGASSDTSDDAASGPFMAGETISIPVYAHITGLTPSPFTGFSLTLDLGADGDGFPGSPDFFSNFGAQTSIGGSLGFFETAGAGVGDNDFIVNWFGSVQLSSDPNDPTQIFTLSFDSSLSTDAGFYDIVFGQDASSLLLTSYTSNSIPITEIQYDAGRFQVVATAIPEPSTVACLLGVVALGGLRRWRRKVA